VVLLSGEPGIGKSRLVWELRERLSDGPHYLLYQCSPLHTDSALHPVTEHFARVAGFARDDTVTDKLDKLEAVLFQGTDRDSQAAKLLASAMAIPPDGRYPPLDLTSEQQKQRTLEILFEQVRGLTATKPVVMVLEDAQWIDPTTRELFDLVVKEMGLLRLLVVLTVRPGFRLAWAESVQISRLTIHRLGRRQCGAMVEKIAEPKIPPANVVATSSPKPTACRCSSRS
jgi:predicted ATPase